MKVKDLIAQLEEFDSEAEIFVESEDEQLCGCINAICGVENGFDCDTGKFPVAVLLLDRESESIWYNPEDVLRMIGDDLNES